MTMTTIGYGDLTPTTDISKIFTVIYTFIGIGVFVSLAAKLATGLMHHSKRHGHKHIDKNPA
ncbi:MAG: potassium channel family protein [Gammaproteobacteria bacterium]|nr:potassium channel family protein [Gammaproteobacteria bacterium]MDX2488273.1 potassium channel family protein [Gammaproteobacteria bacterium]